MAVATVVLPPASGVLYLCSWREEGGLGLGDLWRAEPVAIGFAAPQSRPDHQWARREWGVTVSPDEKLMMFESSGRPEGPSGAGDLYMSRRVNRGGRRRSIVAGLLATVGIYGVMCRNVPSNPGARYSYGPQGWLRVAAT